MLYGGDAGAEMAATYHSVIGTVKLHGSSVWNFIGTFFQNIYQSPWLPANVKFKTNQLINKTRFRVLKSALSKGYALN